ncbi:MAG: hemerythrin domain-containing protein [Phycisphaerae bacterium]|nr:hemerythrin domain-containing protein [Phycisphaerae bacterium]
MDATHTLREEHQVILRVLDAFEAALGQALDARRVTTAVFAPFLEFFRGFADRCHHGKEEDRLFPCLNRCGMPCDHGPIFVMLEEHRQGRAHVRAMLEQLASADAGDAAAVESVLRHGFGFLDLLRNHIQKEDGVLFNLADQLVQGEQLASLAADYRQVEQQPEFVETYARCRAIADELTKRSP